MPKAKSKQQQMAAGNAFMRVINESRALILGGEPNKQTEAELESRSHY